MAEVVAQVRQHQHCEVLVVDDASTDNTAELASAAGAKVLKLGIRLGAWGASQAGLLWASRHGFRLVATLDADGQHDPRYLQSMLTTMREKDANVVIGACPARLSNAKKLAWRYFRLLTRLKVQDFTSGFRLYDAMAIKHLITGEATLLDYQDVGVLLLLRNKGARVMECSTPMDERMEGTSRVFKSWFVVARYMLQTTVLCIARLGRGTRKKS